MAMETAGSSPAALYTAAECRELDRLAIEEHGLSGFELMQRAGWAAFRELLDAWPDARRIEVCCGKGNNAGDGYIVAGLALEAGLAVTLWQLGDAGALRGDAARARDWALAQGVTIETGPPPVIAGDVVVDALLGTGLVGDLREPFAATTAAIAASGAPVLAIDIPTGVDADTGAAARGAVRASRTVTFIGRKLGLYTGPGVAYAGRVVFFDLGVPAAVHRAVPGCPWLAYPDLGAAARPACRDANAYKQSLGHVAVVGGDHGMGGAPAMAAEAALRAGAGMVSVLTRPGHRPALLARRPELMVADAEDAAARRAVLGKATCLVVGPGLGDGEWGHRLLEEALATASPVVLDADGLNGLARHGLHARGPLIITPHVGEAARLLGWRGEDVQNDRPAAAQALAARVRGTAVLKGAGTMVATAAGGETSLLGVCAHGNPGMASAGMGDVLAGIIGALLAQGMAPPSAAVAGVCLHSYAGDVGAGRLGQRSLVATDLIADMVDILAREGAP